MFIQAFIDPLRFCILCDSTSSVHRRGAVFVRMGKVTPRVAHIPLGLPLSEELLRLPPG